MTWHGEKEEVPFQEIGMDSDKWDLLKGLAEDSDYWGKAFHFMEQVKHRSFSSLSDAQKDWLYTIDAGLGVELNKIQARFAFDDGKC